MPATEFPVLTFQECRVLGSLVEKSFATPEYYPMTVHALVNACNQKSNREPTVNLTETDVNSILVSLNDKRLAAPVLSTGSRVFRYRHLCNERWALPPEDLVILMLLVLRGPQTPGELNSRSGSMKEIGQLDRVLTGLRDLSEGEHPMVVQLPKLVGQKEARWMHLLMGAEAASSMAEPGSVVAADRVVELEKQVTDLRAELDALKAEFQSFRASFE
ncbi:MAG: DUF480 domain-containing protein [Bacteroidetes bacterium]|nr:DUF480 domain-containing protein [Bacteroidota bacterium]